MKFVHEDPDFGDLVDIAAEAGPMRSATMVEKDYWICHTLWSLERSGLQIWFKGGTSLSKAYHLTTRFSEDIDLVVLPGSVQGLPPVSSWKREDAGPSARRRHFWEAIGEVLDVPGCEIVLDHDHDPTYRGPGFLVRYPALRPAAEGHPDSVLRPSVLLEFSYGDNARTAVAPSVRSSISSAVHDQLARSAQHADYLDNRPLAIDCVHPYVTLLEKLDAITRRYARADTTFSAASFARHYEDAARIIQHEAHLPPISCTVEELALTMLADRQIRRLVRDDDEAFLLSAPRKRRLVEDGYHAIAPMFWADRILLDQAIHTIRDWLQRHPFPR